MRKALWQTNLPPENQYGGFLFAQNLFDFTRQEGISEKELNRVNKILAELNMLGAENIILIDARKNNKPSASTI